MLRRRFEEERPLINEQQPTNDEPIKTSIHIVSSVYAVVAIIFGVLLYDGIVKLSNRTPTQLKISDEVKNLCLYCTLFIFLLFILETLSELIYW